MGLCNALLALSGIELRLRQLGLGYLVQFFKEVSFVNGDFGCRAFFVLVFKFLQSVYRVSSLPFYGFECVC